MEVTADKASEFGIQWNLLNPGKFNSNSTQVGGGTNFNARGSGANILDAQANLKLGRARASTWASSAARSRSPASAPSPTSRSSPAPWRPTTGPISCPRRTCSRSTTSRRRSSWRRTCRSSPASTRRPVRRATVTPFQTIERKDVGLILTVKPQITEGGGVRMAIYQEVSSIADTTNPAGIITNKRSLESAVEVEDGQIIVLGGLIQDSFTDGSNKIPVAGDIPVVGALFPLRQPAAHQDQPDDLPQADGRALGSGVEFAHCRPLRLPDG